MDRLTVRRLAEVAITVQFLALVRTLAEYFRLRQVQGAALPFALVDRYLAGALFASVGLWAAVIGFFLSRYRLTVGVAAATILALLVYKLVAIG